jgi:hypothetical protein
MGISICSPKKKSCVSSVHSSNTHTSSSFNVYDNKNHNVLEDIERENIILRLEKSRKSIAGMTDLGSILSEIGVKSRRPTIFSGKGQGNEGIMSRFKQIHLGDGDARNTGLKCQKSGSVGEIGEGDSNPSPVIGRNMSGGITGIIKGSAFGLKAQMPKQRKSVMIGGTSEPRESKNIEPPNLRDMDP